jgi:hypothetical protein
MVILEERLMPPKKKKEDIEIVEPPSLADDIEDQIEHLDESGEVIVDFSPDEKQKLNILRSHRRILSELWNNYQLIRDSGQESNKKNYLVSIANELVEIQKLEASEQDLMSALSEVRKVMETEPPEDVLDRILGWEIKRLVFKSDKPKMVELLSKLIKECQVLLTDVENIPKEDAFRLLEDRLYGK